MKGLLMKDFRILYQQKKTMLIMLFVGVAMIMTIQDRSYIVGYLTLMASSLTMGTISYDEFDNGYAFLFTLPITRKEYAISKYVLNLLMCTVVWTVANLAIMLVENGSYNIVDIVSAVILLMVALVMQSVMIPLQLKFGAEKSRIVLFMIIGVFAVGGIIIEKFSNYLPSPQSALSWLESLGYMGFLGIVLAICMVVLTVSACISCKIMEKKQI